MSKAYESADTVAYMNDKTGDVHIKNKVTNERTNIKSGSTKANVFDGKSKKR